jgi:hypothetical protein
MYGLNQPVPRMNRNTGETPNSQMPELTAPLSWISQYEACASPKSWKWNPPNSHQLKSRIPHQAEIALFYTVIRGAPRKLNSKLIPRAWTGANRSMADDITTATHFNFGRYLKTVLLDDCSTIEKLGMTLDFKLFCFGSRQVEGTPTRREESNRNATRVLKTKCWCYGEYARSAQRNVKT